LEHDVGKANNLKQILLSRTLHEDERRRWDKEEKIERRRWISDSLGEERIKEMRRDRAGVGNGTLTL
jgi:hypothetical protein